MKRRNRTTLEFMAGPELQVSPDFTSAMDEADAMLERARAMRGQKIEQAATIRALAGDMEWGNE